MQNFELVSQFEPAGDQPQAIAALTRGIREGKRNQVLMGVTGSGKTFTMANVIAQIQRPTLVLSHNKTLAAQLYGEFREFFPHNAVAYFVSYYDYYQPEAYIPQRDIYIEKDASINEEIDRLRLMATSALVSRRDVIVVASVSCIYGLGSPKDYLAMMVPLHVGDIVNRDELLLKLVDIHYERNDLDPSRGKFRVRGDVIECWPAYEEFAYRIELWGDQIESLSIINPLTGDVLRKLDDAYVYPAKHFVLPQERIERALVEIQGELDHRLEEFRARASCSKRSGWRPAHATIWSFAGSRLLSGHRELQPGPRGPQAGRASLHAARLLSRRFFALRRRVARHDAAGPRHVRRRPLPQDDARRARLSAADGPRQPAAQVRRVGRAATSRRSSSPRLRPTGNWSKAAAKSSSR